VIALIISVMYEPMSFASASTLVVVGSPQYLIACLKSNTAAFTGPSRIKSSLHGFDFLFAVSIALGGAFDQSLDYWHPLVVQCLLLGRRRPRYLVWQLLRIYE